MKKKKGVSLSVIIWSLIMLIVIICLIGVAFYIYNNQNRLEQSITLTGGKVALTYSDDENLFLLENAIPTSDIVGTKIDSQELYFDFTVNTEVDDANFIEYEIVLVKDDSFSTAKNENIKVYLEKQSNGKYIKVKDPIIFDNNCENKKFTSDAMSIFKLKKMISGNDNYRLRLWLSDTAVFDTNEIQNFGVKILLRGSAK